MCRDSPQFPLKANLLNTANKFIGGEIFIPLNGGKPGQKMKVEDPTVKDVRMKAKACCAFLVML